jgi:uncharacterized NAD(P)/FAD-binding protein YdhS
VQYGALFETRGRRSRHRSRIAIVGCGPTGMIVATALLRKVEAPVDLVFFDPAETPGSFAHGPRGRATLNECAGVLSVIGEDGGDFTDWLRHNMLGGMGVTSIHALDQIYVPVSLFRDYLLERFGSMLSGRRDASVQVLTERVVRIVPWTEGMHVRLAGGDTLAFDWTFIATGYGLAMAERRSWEAAIRLLETRGSDLLLFGDGPRLAAIALFLKEEGFRGRLLMSSSSGRLPTPHARSPSDRTYSPNADGGLVQAVRDLRQVIDRAERVGDTSWQSIVDSASRDLTAHWPGLPPQQQARFWRHLEPFHRNATDRLAPDVHRRWLASFENAGADRPGLPRGSQPADPMLSPAAIDCREHPVPWELAELFCRAPEDLGVDMAGHLLVSGRHETRIFIIGRAAAGIWPGPFTTADVVRQADGASMEIQRAVERV